MKAYHEDGANLDSIYDLLQNLAWLLSPDVMTEIFRTIMNTVHLHVLELSDEY